MQIYCKVLLHETPWTHILHIVHYLYMRGHGHCIREWRGFRGLTQEQLADRDSVSISASVISKIETGKVQYLQKHLEEFADALDCESSDLLRPPPSEESAEIIDLVAKLEPAGRRQVLRVIRAITNVA